MKISLDTKEESRDDLRMLIKMLQAVVDDPNSPLHSGSSNFNLTDQSSNSPYKNIFSDDSSNNINQFSESNPSPQSLQSNPLAALFGSDPVPSNQSQPHPLPTLSLQSSQSQETQSETYKPEYPEDDPHSEEKVEFFY